MFDVDELQKCYSNSSDQQDKRTIDAYQDAKMKVIFQADDVKHMHTDAAKKLAYR